MTTTACVQSKPVDNRAATDGGVFKSADKGNTWQQRALIPTTTGKPKRFSSVNVAVMEMDPSDEKAVYYGSIGNGLIYTLDGGGSWMQASNLGNVTIRSIAVDAEDRCTVFIAVGNKIHKTTECTRSWDNVYYDNDPATSLDAIAIDHYNSNIVFIGNSRGDVIKSVDGGESWHTIYRIKGASIRRIVINPNDSRVIYLYTKKKGIYRTMDGGETWDEEVNEALSENGLAKEIKGISFVKDDATIVYVATKYGFMRSEDKGETWKKLSLIPPEKNATINAISVNQRNSQEIYYVTNTTFYRSLDGGANWSTVKIPSTRAGVQLIVDPKSPNIVYLGVRAFTKK